MLNRRYVCGDQQERVCRRGGADHYSIARAHRTGIGQTNDPTDYQLQATQFIPPLKQSEHPITPTADLPLPPSLPQ